MNLPRQQFKVYLLIKNSLAGGITSQTLRELTHIVDIPKTISLLKSKGYKITSTPEKLGSSTIKRYFLEQSQVNYRIEWDNETNTAKKVYITPQGEFTLE